MAIAAATALILLGDFWIKTQPLPYSIPFPNPIYVSATGGMIKYRRSFILPPPRNVAVADGSITRLVYPERFKCSTRTSPPHPNRPFLPIPTFQRGHRHYTIVTTYTIRGIWVPLNYSLAPMTVCIPGNGRCSQRCICLGVKRSVVWRNSRGWCVRHWMCVRPKCRRHRLQDVPLGNRLWVFTIEREYDDLGASCLSWHILMVLLFFILFFCRRVQRKILPLRLAPRKLPQPSHEVNATVIHGIWVVVEIIRVPMMMIIQRLGIMKLWADTFWVIHQRDVVRWITLVRIIFVIFLLCLKFNWWVSFFGWG